MHTFTSPHARQGIAIRINVRIMEEFHQALLHGVAHDMLPATGLVVDPRPLQSDNVQQETLRQAMLAQHLGRASASLWRQLQTTVPHDMQQPVTLHTGHGL